MPVTTTTINAVITELLRSIRELDIQGFTNQDNPTLVNRRYKISNITISVSPNFVTVITLDSVADAANFRVNEVVKFIDILDDDLSDELDNALVGPDVSKIKQIAGANLIFWLDSSEFTGTFVSGKISSSYNMTMLQTIAEQCISDFERDSGIPFISTSYHHMRFIRNLAKINFGSLAGAEKLIARDEYKQDIENIKKYKGINWDKRDIDTTDADELSDFSNEEFLRDMGFGSNNKPLTD
jgi:hypothetical protein